MIDDARARQLCSDVRRCTYYETCATYGLNVNRVFTDGMYVCHIQNHMVYGAVEDGQISILLGTNVSFFNLISGFFATAAQKIMAAKKQAALLASCKSLPNSPSHSGGSTPVSGVFPGQVKPTHYLLSIRSSFCYSIFCISFCCQAIFKVCMLLYQT